GRRQGPGREARFRGEAPGGAVDGGGDRPRAAAPHRLLRPRHLGHCGGGSVLQHDQPPRLGDRHAAEQPVSRAGPVSMMRIATAALIALIALTNAGRAQPADRDADQNMSVARYYASRGDHTGAINRLKFVLRQSPSSQHSEEALARLTEEYLAVGITREAQNAAAVVARKFRMVSGPPMRSGC